MTTDAFTTAARAEAGTLYAVDWDTPAYYDAEDRRDAAHFLSGAEWARDHLAAEIRKARADALREAKGRVYASAWWADGDDNLADRVRGFLSQCATDIEKEQTNG